MDWFSGIPCSFLHFISDSASSDTKAIISGAKNFVHQSRDNGLLMCLLNNSWLKDDVVNQYLSFLSNEFSNVFFFNTGFLTTLGEKNPKAASAHICEELSPSQIMRRSNAFRQKITDSHKFLVFPINIRNVHWCVAIASCETFELFIYDSMGANKLHTLVRKNLVLFLESLKKGTWVKKRLISNPAQKDGVSCGVFICAFIYAFLKTSNLYGQEMFWGQKNIPFLRMFMLDRILNMSNE